MSEWLTTGQMIDRLKVGEIAECSRITNKVFINNQGNIQWTDKLAFRVTDFIRTKAKWRILPQYVSFEEAMKALEEKKVVKFYDGDRGFSVEDSKYWSETPLQDYRLLDLVKGRWTIEEESE